VAITGYSQKPIKHLSEATEHLESDATGVYSSNCHMAKVRGLLIK